MLAVFLLGAWRWAAFVGYGQPGLLTYMDWTRAGYYYAAVEDSLRHWTLPLYYPSGLDGEWVNFYWAHPDTPLLPHILLLRFLAPGTFILLTTLAFYAAGCAGVLALARRYDFSLTATLLLAVLFLGNGYIVGHLRAGHVAWLAYFLVPWWCVYTWALADGVVLPGTGLALGSILALILLNGATHIAIWCWVVLAIIAATRPRTALAVIHGACWFVLMTAIRLVPTLTVFPLDVVTHFAWLGGYRWNLLLAAIFGGQPWIRLLHPYEWEYDAYLGGPAILFLILCGLLLPFFLPGRGRHIRLLAAVSPFVFAMCGDSIAILRNNPSIPLLSGERIPTRMVIMPIVVLIIQACWSLDRVLKRAGPALRRPLVTCAALLLCLTTAQLSAYMIVSAPIPRSQLIVPPPYSPTKPSGSGWGVMPIAEIEHDPRSTKREVTFDMIYVAAIKMGALITGAGLVLALAQTRRVAASGNSRRPPDVSP